MSLMGYVKKEGASWFYSTDLGPDPITGKRRRKKKRGFNTKRDAEKALALVEADVYKGSYFEPSSIEFQDHIKNWYKSKRNNINVHTAETYEVYINNRIIPSLGHVPLSKVSPVLLQNFVNELKEEGLASATIKKVYNILKGSLDFAVNMELISSNPITKIQLPKDKKKEMNVWDVKEINAFLQAASQERLYPAFQLALTTGMRRGEILGLRWKDIDFDNASLCVRQTLSHDGKHFLTGAKTLSGVRNIKLSNETLIMLKKQKTTIAKEKLICGPNYEDYDLIICSTKGTPINPSNLKRTYHRIISMADVPLIRFHDLRHTHATMLLSQGIHAKVISERLGHSNIKTTLDIYSHVLPSMQEEAANKIDALFAK